MQGKLYEYRTIVVDQHDGDTFRADIDMNKFVRLRRKSDEIDLGFNFMLRRDNGTSYRLWLTKQAFRLNRLNAPEVTGIEKPQGLLSKEFVNQYLLVGKEVWVRTIKDKKEKYGRYLAEVYPEGFQGPNLNDLIIQKGFGKIWDGTGERPV